MSEINSKCFKLTSLNWVNDMLKLLLYNKHYEYFKFVTGLKKIKLCSYKLYITGTTLWLL